MKILIIGLGSMGRRHYTNLRELGLTDFAFCRSRPEPLEDAPAVPVFTNLEDAMKERPDLVLVTSPSPAHLSSAVPAARGGCHLFIEKPLAAALEGVEELDRIVCQNGTVAMVGYDLRFDEGLLYIERLLSEGGLGGVLSVRAHVGQYLPEWRPGDYRKHVTARAELGGGVILELIHEFDYLLWLLGAVDAVSCVSGHVSRLDMNAEDVAVCHLRFASGALGSVHLDCVDRIASRGCRIICEESTIIWDSLARTVEWLEPGTTRMKRFSYSERQRNDRLVAEMRHLLMCVEGVERPRVDLDAARRSLRLALAAKRSADRGGAVEEL
jgi:predicted dehydrogenase